MQEIDDISLLRDYTTQNSESAFEMLVSRHVDFVYSSALRQVRNPELAGEITQTVFIILAQKAARISEKTILTGWLFKTTRFVAIEEIRKAVRRRQYEQESNMQSEIESTTSDTIWEQMSPLLDGALAALGEKDRQAVLLRFFENKSLAEVGNHFGTNEDTAGKRVARALEKLRSYFSKCGVASTTAIIAGAISTNSVHAAPVALAKSISAVALAKGAMVGGSTFTFINALKLMALAHAKTALVIGLAVLMTAGTTILVQHQHRATEQMKYSTPEKTFQTWYTAMSTGDTKAYLASLTPEGRDLFLQTTGKGKSESEIVAMNNQIASMIGSFQIVSNEVISSNESILHVQSARLGNVNAPLKKIASEWKISGNITAGKSAK
jgi:RNA polymerase sigma factor (sigma-70 family)